MITKTETSHGADEIATEYDLTLADIYAALTCYFDYRNEIDQSIEKSESFVEALRQSAFSKIKQRLDEQRLSGTKF